MNVSDNYETYKYNMYTSGNSLDDSRWATDEEMKNSLREITIDSNHYKYGGMPIISNGKKAFVDDRDAHSLILGATGSKKTRLLCMPLLNILAKAGESFIATDPKGELYERTSGILAENGYKVVTLNFRDPSYGDSWNPFALPYKYYKEGRKDEAVEMLNDFISSITPVSTHDPYWNQSAGQFCFGLTLLLLECAKEEEVNTRSMTYLRRYINSDNDDGLLHKLFNNLNKQTMAAISLSAAMTITERNRGTMLSVIDQIIRIFSAQQNLSQMLSTSSFDISRIGMEKTAVFLIMPDEKNTYHFLVTTFVKQCYESLIKVAQTQPGNKLPYRTNFILDEFANIPTIPNMPSMITAARSRNIRFYLVVQSEHQLRNQYKENAQTIKGNCDNWVFLTSRELPLLQELSQLCGFRKKLVSSNFAENLPLISVSHLQRLSKERGEALVFHGREYPFITQLADIDQYNFRQSISVPLTKRESRPVPVFELQEYLKNHTEQEIQRLFSDEIYSVSYDMDDNEEDKFQELNGIFDEL